MPSSSMSRRPHRSQTTYQDLLRKSAQAARVFRQVVGHGRIIAIPRPRSSEYLYATQLAVLKSGSAHVCASIRTSPDDQLGHILRDLGARAPVTDAQGHERAMRIR